MSSLLLHLSCMKIRAICTCFLMKSHLVFSCLMNLTWAQPHFNNYAIYPQGFLKLPYIFSSHITGFIRLGAGCMQHTCLGDQFGILGAQIGGVITSRVLWFYAFYSNDPAEKLRTGETSNVPSWDLQEGKKKKNPFLWGEWRTFWLCLGIRGCNCVWRYHTMFNKITPIPILFCIIRA